MVVVDELVAERIHGWRPDAIRSAIQAHRPPAASSAADPSTPPAAAEPVAAAEGTDAIGDGAHDLREMVVVDELVAELTMIIHPWLATWRHS